MDSRQRSPSYPSTPLEQAIDMARELHLVERTNPVDREVAAKAMGYSGISGRSATVLSNLIQFGLLAKTGKNEVRLTSRAVEILYPETQASRVAALKDAAREPELFQRIMDRFTDGLPSQAALEAFLIRQGFTHTAIPAASRAFLDTFLFLENAIGSESYSQAAPAVLESQINQQLERTPHMNATPLPPPRADRLQGNPDQGPQPYEVSIRQKMLWLSGTIRDQAEADDVIAVINGLKSMLSAPKPESSEPPAPFDD
ncbi:MAG: hypothetical protein M9924_07075 [Rhizobiaceae bacterium]|nr:hypothetical protein [Rhizobiaceae bacterium]